MKILLPTTTLGINLPKTTPMTSLPPSGKLFYMDFKYDNKLRERRLKIEKIMKKKCNSQQG